MAPLRRALLLSLLAAPALAQGADRRRTLSLDELFEALKLAPDDASAHAVEARIRLAWMQAGSPAVQLLMRRGLRSLEARAFEEAVEDFDAVITLAPEVAEGWNKRATAYFMLGDYRNAVRDIQETLAREPRHFDALAGLSLIEEAVGDHMAALRAHERALLLNPRMAGGEARLKELRRRALGEES